MTEENQKIVVQCTRLQTACLEFVKELGYNGNTDILAMQMMQVAAKEYSQHRKADLLNQACSCINGFRSLYDETDPEAIRIYRESQPYILRDV